MQRNDRNNWQVGRSQNEREKEREEQHGLYASGNTAKAGSIATVPMSASPAAVIAGAKRRERDRAFYFSNTYAVEHGGYTATRKFPTRHRWKATRDVIPGHSIIHLTLKWRKRWNAHGVSERVRNDARLGQWIRDCTIDKKLANFGGADGGRGRAGNKRDSSVREQSSQTCSSCEEKNNVNTCENLNNITYDEWIGAKSVEFFPPKIRVRDFIRLLKISICV